MSGNRLGRGNPHARRQAEMHRAFMAAVTPEEMQSLAASLWIKAKNGDVAAAQLVLAYMIGKPRTAPDPDAIDLGEWKLAQAHPTLAEVLAATFDGVAPGVAAAVARVMQHGTDSSVRAVAESLPGDGPAAMQKLLKRIRGTTEDMDLGFDETPTLQVGELRKARCKRGGK